MRPPRPANASRREAIDAANAAFGIDIGGTKLALGLVEPDGRVLARRVRPLRRDGALIDVEEAVRTVGQFLDEEGDGTPPLAFGAAVAASLDGAGRILFAPNLTPWLGAPLGSLLEGAVGCRTHIVLDGAAALWGERWLGGAQRLSDAVLLAIGTGVGGGILAGGRLILGVSGLAGVAGYLRVDGEAGRARLEDVVSGPALARRLSAAVGAPLSARDLFRLAGQGDGRAKRVLDVSLDALGEALAAITSLLAPEAILLGGGLGPTFARAHVRLEAAVTRLAQPDSAARVRVRAARLGNDAAWLGAARLALDLGAARDQEEDADRRGTP